MAVVTDPIERAKLQAKLDEARDALHKLQLGQSARVLVDQNGERVEFTPATVTRLTAYIAELEALLGLANGRASAPMRFIW